MTTTSGPATLVTNDGATRAFFRTSSGTKSTSIQMPTLLSTVTMDRSIPLP
jgi:hypothetical protein